MKLRTRLLLLIATTLVLFCAAAASYFIIQSPINTIEAEHRYFTVAAESITNLELQTGRLLIDTFGDQKPVYDEALKAYYAAMDDIGTKVVTLPKINAALAAAVESVKSLRALSDTNFATLESTFKDIRQASNDVFYTADNGYLLKFFSNDTRGADPDLVKAAQSKVFSLEDCVQNLNSSLSAAADTLKEKDTVIASEIAKIQARSLAIVLVIVSLIVLFAIVLALIMARSILRSIKGLVREIDSMATGDLTGRFALGSRDEIGHLGQNLNQVMEMFNSSLGEIQTASSRNIAVRENLNHAVNESESSSSQIEANVGSIRTRMEWVDSMIASSSQDMDRVTATISGFSKRMVDQNENVEDSVAAVTEMLASIDNIARITENDKQSTEALVQESERGREVFESAFERVSEIGNSVSTIQDMANVIAGIASQTNILAMNAAIEAAHAGEFGKGFAVVADEISKLAAASAASSGEIAQTIKEIVERITDAAATRDTTINVFSGISSRIREVSDSVGEIYGNVEEMRSGSRQLQETNQQLRLTSAAITEESARIDADISGVRSTLAKISLASQEVVSNIGEISTGLHLISNSIQTVAGYTDELGEIGGSLNTAVNRFRTEQNEARESEAGATGSGEPV